MRKPLVSISVARDGTPGQPLCRAFSTSCRACCPHAWKGRCRALKLLLSELQIIRKKYLLTADFHVKEKLNILDKL